MSTKKKYLFSKGIDSSLEGFHNGYHFMTRFFREAFTLPIHWREIINQCFEIGLKSLSIITLTGFIVGVVFTKQSRPSLENFGATSWLPSLMGIAIIRALGPLVTSLICAGKVGSGISAELGSMRVTEQIDAMEVSAINPFKYLVATRIIATTISIPILSMYCNFVALVGSFYNVHNTESTSLRVYVKNAFSNVSFLDINSSLFKAVAYGFTIGMVGCYKGYYAAHGTRGVGKATNQAVILSIFLIFFEEVIIVQIINWIRYY